MQSPLAIEILSLIMVRLGFEGFKVLEGFFSSKGLKVLEGFFSSDNIFSFFNFKLVIDSNLDYCPNLT